MKKKVIFPIVLILLVAVFTVFSLSQNKISEEERIIEALHKGISTVEDKTGTDLTIMKDEFTESISGYAFDTKNAKVVSDIRKIVKFLYHSLEENNLSSKDIIGNPTDSYSYVGGEIFVGIPNYDLSEEGKDYYMNPWGKDYLVAYINYDDNILFQVIGFQKISSGETRLILQGSYEKPSTVFPVSLFKDKKSGIYLSNDSLINEQGNISKLENIQGSSSYKKAYNLIYYKENILNGADFESFKVIDAGGRFAIDKNNFYDRDKNIDLKSTPSLDLYNLVSVEGRYFKDKNNIYFLDFKENSTFMIVIGADLKTFKGGAGLKASDKHENYYKGIAIIQ